VSARIPSYRHHKARNLAVVTIDGRDVYLGRFGTPESRAEYDRVVAEWLARGRGVAPAPPPSAGGTATVAEVILAYWRHAEREYTRPDGTPAPELEKVRLALGPLRRLYGTTPADDFDPERFLAVREHLIGAGLARRTINDRMARVVRAFAHAAEKGLARGETHYRLAAVKGIRKGRRGVKRDRKVRPVADAPVEAVRPFVSRQVAAMIDLQRLTGARSGEVCTMRTGDVDRGAPVWIYTPRAHKTEDREIDRRIYIGPRAQAILTPWLKADPDAYLFSPAEAMAERWAAQRAAHKTPLTPSQRARTRKARPEKTPGPRYDPRSYAEAIERACDRAFPHPTLAGVKPRDRTAEQRAELAAWRREHRWHPHQLRHAAGTWLRREFGAEVARLLLGHAHLSTTELYAEADLAKAAAAMGQVG
jgi:integrase